MDQVYLETARLAAKLTDPTIDQPAAAKRTALYRHFDAERTLLYVGISLQTIRRIMQHRMYADWFMQVASINLEWFATRPEAELAEQQAIRNEHPVFNQTFSRKPQQIVIKTKSTKKRMLVQREARVWHRQGLE